ncbi:MAG: HD domain-containing protein [Fibrella sp.]|nr:HD domain-containing protein [Armatimonadota bacterium]
MTVVETHPTMDLLLEQWRPNLGADYLAYRNHVYRVFNFSICLACATGDDIEKLAIAAAFHDVGMWLDNTFDYLKPSSRRAMEYLSQIDREEWSEAIHQIIDQHHKVRTWRGSEQNLVESFRKADWLDVCLFALPSKLKRDHLTDVLHRFPREGFHRRLVFLTWGWARKHPLNPLPIFKW